MMADPKHLLEFLEGGVGMLFNMGVEFFGVQLAPVSPALFRGQRAFLGGGQIAVNGASTQIETARGLDFGTTRVEEFHHPFPQVQSIGFHAHEAYQAMCQCQYELL